MQNKLLFSISALFCVNIFIISATEVSENNVIKLQKILSNHVTLDAFVNKGLHSNASQLKVAQVEECKCENGKCIRECDLKKDTPCDDRRMVCVCNPEFAKTSDDKCEYCDCGQGINCTFLRSANGYIANCICPEGYYKEYDPYVTKCKPECSDVRPCKNGGSCTWYRRCECPYGTKGALCQEIMDCSSKCENRLEVDCLFNHEKRIAYCSCKNSSLYFDQEANICKPCPCENGFCDYEFTFSYQKLICKCRSGYKMFKGYCKKCDCGYGASEECAFDSRGERICKCADGYFEREGSCLPCGCYDYSSLETRCEVTGNVKRCFCREGFRDVNGYCEDIDECETNNTCHPSTTCHNTFGSFDCKCPEGYEGNIDLYVKPGEVCKDINECKELTNGCWYSNSKCVNLPGSYKCECFKGYRPRSYSDEPQRTMCTETSMNVFPAVIVVFTSFVLIVVSSCMHSHLKKKALRTY